MTTKKKTTKKSTGIFARKVLGLSETDIRITKVENGYTVTTYDNDYNDIIHVFHTEPEVREYIECFKF